MDAEISEVLGLKQDIIKEFLIKMYSYVQNGISSSYDTKELSVEIEKKENGMANLHVYIKGGDLLKNRYKESKDPSTDFLCAIPFFNKKRNIIHIGSVKLENVKLIIPTGFDVEVKKTHLVVETTKDVAQQILLEIMDKDKIIIKYKVEDLVISQGIKTNLILQDFEKQMISQIVKMIPDIKRELNKSVFTEVFHNDLISLIDKYEEFSLTEFYFKDEMLINDLFVLLELAECEMRGLDIEYTRYVNSNQIDVGDGKEALIMYFNSIMYNNPLLSKKEDITNFYTKILSKNQSFFFKVLNDNKKNGIYNSMDYVQFLDIPLKTYYKYYKNVIEQVEELPDVK